MSNKGYDPRSVVNCMIAIGNRRGIKLTNVAIQKLLYFAHASFWIEFNRPLIDGVFEAWEYGPVCPPIYHSLKQYGREAVSIPIQKHDLFTGEVTEITQPDDEDVRLHIGLILNRMGNLSPGHLIDLSHAKGGAWEEVWNKSKTNATISNRIHDTLTVERFSRLRMVVRNTTSFGDVDEASPLARD